MLTATALINADVAIGPDTSLIYKYREGYRRDKLLTSWSQSGSSRRRSQLSSESRLSVGVRTGRDSVVMRTEPRQDATTLQVCMIYNTTVSSS